MSQQTELTDLTPLTDNEEVLTTVKKYLENYQSQRSQLDGEFFKYEAYYRGSHFTTWNPLQKTLNEPPAKQGEVRIPIPISKDIIQRTLLEITKDKPKFQVIPDSTSDEEVQRARWSNQLLDALFEKHRLGKKIKQVVLHGLKFSVGIMEVFWNPELEKGRGEVDFRVVDPADFYIGLNFEDVSTAPCVIKVVRKDIGYLLNSDLYKKLKGDWASKIKPDNKVTNSEWREQVLSRAFGTSDSTHSDVPPPQGQVLLAEAWLRYYPNDSTDPKYRVVTFCVKQDLILRNEETDLDEPPFVIYHTDQSPGEFYGEGWLKHLIPLNRAMDLIENKILSHHHKFIGGKYKMDAGADPTSVTNDAGQFIEVNPGKRFEALDVPPIPPTSRDTVSSWHQYAQDTGGVHEASLGRLPQGVESGRSLEALQHGDQQAKSDLRDNLEDFMEEAGEKALNLVSDNYTSSRLVSFYDEHGELQQQKVIGESAPEKVKNGLGAAVIKPRNDVKVTVGSRLGDTVKARQDAAMELFHMSLIPPEEVLKEFGYSNIADMAQRAWERAEKVAKLKEEKPQPKETKDYINTQYQYLAPNQQAAYSEQLGLPAPSDPAQVPGSLAAQLTLEHAKTAAKLDTQEHSSLLSQTQGAHQVLGDLASQQAASLDPTIPGGVNDPTAELNPQGEQNA